MRNLRFTFAVSGLIGLASCVLLDNDFQGQPCSEDSQCPDFYRCVAGPSPGVKICEVTFPSRYVPPTPDAGTPDAGATPYYCTEVAPLLNQYCVSSCHGQDTRNSGRADFRLDYYAGPDGGGGAYAQAINVKRRVAETPSNPMPPLLDLMANPVLQIPDAGRLVLSRWVLAGAPYCRTSSADAGTDAGTDAGSPDSGVRDAGVDSGTPGVPFAAVQLIFNSRCNGACHRPGTLSGNLDLTAAGNPRNALVNVGTSGGACGVVAGRMRVTPGNPMASQLYLKVTNAGAKCGNAMPGGTTGLSNGAAPQPAEAQTISDWIMGGAQN